MCVCGAVTLALCPFVTCHFVCGQAWKMHAHIHRFTDNAFTSSPRHTHSYTLVAVEAEHQCKQVFVCLLMTDIGICFQAQNQTTYFLQAFLIIIIISDAYDHYFLTVNKKLLSNSLVETLQNISNFQLFSFLFFF